MKKQSVLFPELFAKPVVAEFSDERLTSDGGSIILAGLDKQVGLTESMAGDLVDRRASGKIKHSVLDLLRQRVFSIASGYEDANDASRMKSDPVLKLSCDRCPITGEDLASQPTLSRFENSIRRRDLHALSLTLARKVLEFQKSRRKGNQKARHITIDMDAYCDPTHGGQQLTFFNHYYDTHCYLPQLVTLCFDHEPRQYAIGAILRPGNKGAKHGVVPILKRLLKLIRKSFPKATLHFRADSHFSAPEILQFLETGKVLYTIGIGKNSVLEGFSKREAEVAETIYELSGEAETFYSEHNYQAGSWKKERRVVYKAEVVTSFGKKPKLNLRYLVTNKRHIPRNIFKWYQQRGDMENRIKELKHDLMIDRTSCESFEANQFRMLLTLAAYILFQMLQDKLSDTELKNAQVGTLRERLFKIAARVTESTRRIVIHFTDHYPWMRSWSDIAHAVQGVT